MVPKFFKMELMIQEHLMFPNYSRSKGISNGSMDFDNACPWNPNYLKLLGTKLSCNGCYKHLVQIMSQKLFADGVLIRGDKYLMNSPSDHFQRMEHLTDKIYEWSQRQRKAAEDALYETHGALSISIILVIVILFVGFVKLVKDSLRRCLM